jgi:hypothetical protein
MRIALSVICFSILSATSVKAQQQIPDGGFESWRYTGYQADVPAGAPGMSWVSGDSLMFLRCGWSQQPQVAKVTNAHSGQYALCLQESFYVAPIGGNFVEENGGGYISLGIFDTNNFKPLGVTYTAHPSALTGFYKLTADTPGVDTANIRIGFKSAGGGSIIAQGGQSFYTKADTWQPFTIPIYWSNNQQPAKLMLDMSVGATDAVCGDTSTRFYLDDLSFVFANGIYENLFADEHIHVYPNPTTDIINIKLDKIYTDSDYSITIHDAAGRIVSGIGQVQEAQQLSLRNYGSGTYFLQLHRGSETVYGIKITVTE